MKIAICGSMVFSREMIEIKNELETKGHSVIVPEFTEEYSKMESVTETHKEAARNKAEHDLIRGYFNKINDCDAILIVNEEKNQIPSYIGGNSFLELAFGHVLNKKLFLLNELPNMNYSDEIIAMKPIVLNGDLTKIEKS